jgi:hypothetical protein
MKNNINIKYQNSFSGLTLMELAIAMLIFLIGVLGLLQLVVIGVSLNQRSRDITLATSLTQAKADELLRRDFLSTFLARGGVIPLKAETHPIADNPTPVAGYTDFFNYDGVLLNSAEVPTGKPAKVPFGTYFIRQWQIWSCNCGEGINACTSTCTPSAVEDVLKKITITTTSISPAFQGSFPSTTVVVYKSRLG